MPTLTQTRHELGPDEAGAADDHEFHDASLYAGKHHLPPVTG
jgi:hypothetical protein